MSETGIKHTFWAGPWRNCARCDKKTKIATMKWQRGLLLCTASSGNGKGCWDEPPLLGQREVAIAQILNDGKSEKEFTPVEKLRNPDSFEEAEDFVL